MIGTLEVVGWIAWSWRMAREAIRGLGGRVIDWTSIVDRGTVRLKESRKMDGRSFALCRVAMLQPQQSYAGRVVA